MRISINMDVEFDEEMWGEEAPQLELTPETALAYLRQLMETEIKGGEVVASASLELQDPHCEDCLDDLVTRADGSFGCPSHCDQ